MTVNQIAEKISIKAIKEDFDIAKLPKLREQHYQINGLSKKIFSKRKFFDTDMYAYHHGGRNELQFNFGEEGFDKINYSRWGLCFSLEPSESLKTPIETLTPFKIRFNQCIQDHPEYFKGFEMWYHYQNKRSDFYQPLPISDEWFKSGSFIVLGGVINKTLDELNEDDLKTILIGFDKLLPIYKYCVLNKTTENKIKEKRISRICWNKYDWVIPSGPEGKSTNKDSHENEKGYGHEEWLFDFEKLIDGYHYSLLQPAQKGRETFLNKVFDVRLFSRNSKTGELLWVGIIKNLEVISNEEANTVHKLYLEKGWLNEMTLQLKKEGGDYNNLLSLEPRDCFNVRFKPENAKRFEPYKAIENFDKLIGTYHYSFVRDQVNTELKSEEIDKIKRRNFSFKSGISDKSEVERTIRREKKTTQIKPIHDKLQNILYEKLLLEYDTDRVGVETNTGNSNRIDVCVKSDEGLIIYEVKSYSSVLTSIRVAVGQLMEYAFYPNPIEDLKELIIVSHLPIDEEDKAYLEVLRNKIKLNIYYQSLDIETKILSEKS